VTVLLAVIGVGVAIEASTGSTTGVVGTIRGQIIQVGGPAGVPPQVVNGEVTLTNVSSGLSYQTASGKPGGYSDGNPMHTQGPSPIVVTVGATVHVDLYVPIR
jgi:hypothetical protein